MPTIVSFINQDYSRLAILFMLSNLTRIEHSYSCGAILSVLSHFTHVEHSRSLDIFLLTQMLIQSLQISRQWRLK